MSETVVRMGLDCKHTELKVSTKILSSLCQEVLNVSEVLTVFDISTVEKALVLHWSHIGLDLCCCDVTSMLNQNKSFFKFFIASSFLLNPTERV